MYCLNDQQIDLILNDISSHGIKIEDLQHNLLDHICIIIEQNLPENGDFEQFYSSAIKAFYKMELREIEEETLFLLNRRSHLALSRNQFFVLLFTIFIGPFVAYDIVWLVSSKQTVGLNLPFYIWGATLVYSLFPLLVLLVLLLTPEKFDPIIPKKSMILLGIAPFINIIPTDANPAEIKHAL